MATSGPIFISFNLDTAGFLNAMRQAPRRAARAVYRVVKTNSTEAANKARRKLSIIQNPKREEDKKPESGQRGGTAQGIHATRPVRQASTIFADVKWANPLVGAMLEWGPKKKRWDIAAKYAPALRFGWPNAPQGGFTAVQTGVKGGERVMSLQENVFYFKRVRHIDRPSHRRVHIKPAIEKQEPIFIRDLLRIPKEVIR